MLYIGHVASGVSLPGPPAGRRTGAGHEHAQPPIRCKWGLPKSSRPRIPWYAESDP